MKTECPLLLQEHMVDNLDVLPRQGFSQMARNMRCQLYFPHPTDQVILLRTGVLHHINSYMQTLGLAPPSDPSADPKHPVANGLPDQAAADGPGSSAKGPMVANGDTVMADTVALPVGSDAVGAAQRSLTGAADAMPHAGSRRSSSKRPEQDGADQMTTEGAESGAVEGAHTADEVRNTHLLPRCTFSTASAKGAWACVALLMFSL